LRPTTLILLPGMDGTGKLFKRFVACAPPHLSLRIVTLPPEPLTYTELADSLASIFASDDAPVLLAESYSGPLAIILAARHRVSGVVLCNSFVSAPRSRTLQWLAVPALFRIAASAVLLRRYLLGSNVDDELVRDVVRAVASMPASVLTSRLRSILAVDETIAFTRSTGPILYLRGSEDRLVSENSWRRMAALRPISIARVEGPHLLLQANPAGAWDAITPFLESLA
jgi:pimeloyl-[acyl-carrier protein] methyl ester esterase